MTKNNQMTLRDLKEHLVQYRDDDRSLDAIVKIPVESLSPAIGAHPTVDIVGISHGFDWDDGTCFLNLAQPVQEIGESYQREKAAMDDFQETLGGIHLILHDRTRTAENKVMAIKAMLTKRAKTKA